MNADAFFSMGRGHSVCQDYALVLKDGVALSDGCSASAHTDLGARLLCHLADQEPLGPLMIQRAGTILDQMGAPRVALDATLLTARVEGDHVRVQVTGDGVVVGRRRDGTRRVLHSEFPSGAPRYASYDLDPSRRTRYLQTFGRRWARSCWDTLYGDVQDTYEVQVEDADVEPLTLLFSVDTFDLVLLMSDGALSFVRDGAAKPLLAVVDEMLAFKSYPGQFVARRALRFLKDAASAGEHPYDDFSAAAIYLGTP